VTLRLVVDNGNVVRLRPRARQGQVDVWHARYSAMHMPDLLAELTLWLWQGIRLADRDVAQGIALFERLEADCETEALRSLARANLRQLRSSWRDRT